MDDGCLLPEDLHYLVEHHVWARPDEGPGPDGSTFITVGITDVFQALTQRIMFFTPRRVGRNVRQGDPIAVLESGKWMGTVPSAIEGEIAEFNPALSTSPTLLNRDPYGEGWVARLRSRETDLERQGLVTGPEGVAFYRSMLEAGGIGCGKNRSLS